MQAFKKQAEGTDTALSFQNFVPMPKALEGSDAPALELGPTGDKELMEKYGATNWYQWRLDNWGTKWDTRAMLVDEHEDSLDYEFNTAWSPPIAWLERVAEQYPTLTLLMKYEEEGYGFVGIAAAEDGVVEDRRA